MVSLLLGSFILFLLGNTPSSNGNIITEIKGALDKNEAAKEKLGLFLEYMEMSDLEVIADLPLKNADGTPAHYTLFAPTSWALRSTMPQDVMDPYFDPDLRLQLLLRHFVRRRIGVDDLTKLTTLTMAGSEVYDVKHEEGKPTLNGADIKTEGVIDLPSVIIYEVDRAFTTPTEISEALSRHPSGVAFFGPLPAKPYEELKPLLPNRGYNRAPVDGEQVVSSGNFAVKELSKSPSLGELKLIAIKTAEVQTFYGDLYKLGLEVETTKKDRLHCQAVVFERNWIKETKLSSFECVPAVSASDSSSKTKQ